ncbi:hypothetical protein ACFY1J_05060 [Streptomyces sp. NPDC001406]|uniref:hypothetical protein n=1 Tax=Streptomyces sp. NPDC001406 TaxID=3364572 RepID=UPI0036B7E7DC
MRDGDWLLGYSSYDNYPGASLTFGREDSGIYCLSEPDVSFGDMDLADAALPGEDGVRMGRDYQRNATVTFEMGVDGNNGPIDLHWVRPWANGPRVGDWSPIDAVAAAYNKRDQGPYQWGLDGLNMLRQVWRADSIRGKAGRVAWLVHGTAGRTRQLYGRPRKFAVSHSRFSRQGYTPVVCEFVAVDDRFYEQTEKSIELYDHQWIGLPGRPGRVISGGDWLFKSKKTATFSQRGTENTYPYLEIYGPCTNPKVTVGPELWAVQLSMTIAAGDHVTIDARPWVRTATLYQKSTSKSVADKLTRSSPRLSQMFIPPGNWTASLSFSKTSSRVFEGPRIRMAWRDAYSWW